MNKGINLTLMIGPAVPVPVPKEVLDALTNVQVTFGKRGFNLFQLTFTLSTRSPLHTIFLLSGGSPIPIIRVVIIVTVNGMTEVLMDGVMTNHEVTPGKDPGQATLTVTGEDISRVMDYFDYSGLFVYPVMPRFVRVAAVLAKYAVVGVVPMTVPSVLPDVPIPVERIPKHKGTDLCYIKQLAEEVGYVFYIEPGPKPGMSTAYWGPEIKVGVPQPALNIDMDAHTNVESLSFNYNTDSKVTPILFTQEPFTKALIAVPVPDITPLSPPLGLVSPLTQKYELIMGTTKLSLAQAAMIGLAKAAKTADVVTASGELDVLRYGRVLKARKLVGVRGAGQAFNGLYYVKSVTHKIQRGEYKQSFELSRNGLISTLQRVPA